MKPLDVLPLPRCLETGIGDDQDGPDTPPGYAQPRIANVAARCSIHEDPVKIDAAVRPLVTGVRPWGNDLRLPDGRSGPAFGEGDAAGTANAIWSQC